MLVSFAYLWLLIFLPAILIPACASSSLAFLMIYFAYKLNKQGDNIQPWHTPFPIWNQSVVLCLVLTVVSWPTYNFDPHPSPSYPSRLSQSTGFGCPVPYIKLALVICFTYGNVYVSMLVSQIMLSSPSPTESKICCLCLCLLCCPACRIIITIFLDSTYKNIYGIVFLFLTYFTLYNRL